MFKIQKWADARRAIAELEAENAKLKQELEHLRQLRGTHSRKGDFPGGGYYEIKRNDPPQEAPADGDGVITVATIYLPTGAEYKGAPLADNIVFRNRLTICERPLFIYWGYPCSSGFRCQSKKFVAKTWREAFAEAEKFVHAEARKLQDALDRRAKAFQEAEL